MEVVVELWDLQLFQLDVGRIEREADGEGELGIHQESDLAKGERKIAIRGTTLNWNIFNAPAARSPPLPCPAAWPGSSLRTRARLAPRTRRPGCTGSGA